MSALVLAEPSRRLSPIVRRADDRVAAGLSVDRVIADGDFLALSGWTIGGRDLTFTAAGGAGVPALPSLTFFPRDDVAAGYGVAPNIVRGFLAVWRSRPHGDMQARLGVGAEDPLTIDLLAPKQSAQEELAQLLTENRCRAGRLFEALIHNPAAVSVLAGHLDESPPGFARARGHIENA
ncbi:MAG: hypothetical protein JO288_19445, partial [Hyphomicrobiales bacterium]|nr:hypothetical protein [Hyphomicrobiales bacterium]